jgi:hypothetical protein
MGRGKVPKSLPPLPSGASASRWNLEQTLRRAQAMGDLRNAVSAAAVGRGVLFDNPENMLGAIRQSHLANMDATTLVLHTERGTHLLFQRRKQESSQEKPAVTGCGRDQDTNIVFAHQVLVHDSGVGQTVYACLLSRCRRSPNHGAHQGIPTSLFG